MLSRVADNLYWMSRYLERASQTALLVDVHLNLMLEFSRLTPDQRWRHVHRSLGAVAEPAAHQDTQGSIRSFTLDESSPSSVVACVMSARENARQVREQISSEMWEQLNRLYLQLRQDNAENVWGRQPHEFLMAVVEGAQLFQGVADSTMSHGEGWQFIRAGRFLERMGNVAGMLDAHFATFSATGERTAEGLDNPEWVGLLRSCAAFESYCKIHTPRLNVGSIAEFLILNAEFPHSIRFAADVLNASLESFPAGGSARKAARVGRLAGRLRASLSFSQIDEIMAGGLHGYLDNIKRQCGQIHLSLRQVFIDYPIETAIEA
jgi:uncharacterized alpha-E superfamily protein